jgi:beta-galactosidase GanA
MIRARVAVVGAVMAAWCSVGLAQTAKTTPIPKIVEKDGRWALMVDGGPYLILGAQVNNSSAWPSMLPKVWPTVEAMGINTLEAPIYWEQFEPQKGHYDTTVVHALLEQARAHHVYLVLLWFGLFKNGSGHYTPEWIKRDEEHVPHVMTKDGGKVDSLAAKTQVGLGGDRAAFVELMKYLKANDAQRTVLMMQVENESGTYGSVRDFAPDSNKLFAGQVPAELVTALHKTPGTWSEVFGKDADESFQTYEVSSYINKVAEAGKAVYPLPMYCNVATRDPFHPSPGSWPSGSATDAMIPIWKAVATSIDALGPDLYTPGYATYNKVLDVYHRPDNAMLVPESGNSPEYARYLFDVVGHQGIGFATFGMDATGYVNVPLGADRVDAETIAPFATAYHLIGSMDRVVAKLNFEGKVQGVAEDPSVASQTMSFAKWRVKASWGLGQFGGTSWLKAKRVTPPEGGAMVAELGPDEFLVTGMHVRLEFEPVEGGKQMQYIRVEEGHYEGSVWHFDRIWNGDQTDYGLNFTAMQQVLKVSLTTY